MEKFIVDQDIKKASTIHANFYSDVKNLDLSKEKIFAKTWQFVGNTNDLRLAGQLVPHFLLPGFMDEPVLFSRDLNDEINCFANVCTHRGNLLIESTCNDKQIRCRYHGRRFDLAGKFKHMPEFETVECFPTEKDNLPKVPFGIWENLLFASINPLFSFEEAISEMKNRVAFLPLNEFKFDSNRSRDYLVKAHWALYCENYLEGFHIPFIHQSLNDVIDYNAYTTELFRYSNLQIGISKGGEDVFELPNDSPDYGKNVSAYYFWVFPNMMFNFYPWGLSINIIKPMGTQLTKVSFLTYVYDEAKLNRGAGSILDKVEREDESIVECVQKGINSRFYESGRYSPKRETGTHHFHRLIAEFMNK